MLSHSKNPVSEASDLFPLQAPWLSADSTNIRKLGAGMGKNQASMKGVLMEIISIRSGKSQNLCLIQFPTQTLFPMDKYDNVSVTPVWRWGCTHQ